MTYLGGDESEISREDTRAAAVEEAPGVDEAGSAEAMNFTQPQI